MGLKTLLYSWVRVLLKLFYTYSSILVLLFFPGTLPWRDFKYLSSSHSVILLCPNRSFSVRPEFTDQVPVTTENYLPGSLNLPISVLHFLFTVLLTPVARPILALVEPSLPWKCDYVLSLSTFSACLNSLRLPTAECTHVIQPPWCSFQDWPLTASLSFSYRIEALSLSSLTHSADFMLGS